MLKRGYLFCWEKRAILKVNQSKAYNLLHGGRIVKLRFPSTKPPKVGRSEVTPAKGLLTSGKENSPEVVSLSQPKKEADLTISATLFSALLLLRTLLVKEAGEGVMAYHIFGNATLQQISKKIPRSKDELLEINGIGKAKVSKYGDRVLETTEATIREFYKLDKTSNSSSNDSSDSMKRRRETIEGPNGSYKDEDLINSTGRSKKRVLKKKEVDVEATNYEDPAAYDDIMFDEDLDFDGSSYNGIPANGTNGGRVLPSWSTPGTNVYM